LSTDVFDTAELEKGALLIQGGKVGDVVFSGGTYQMAILDGKETYWPFLQITDDGELKDRFCTCTEGEERGRCTHQAAAWLKIFNHKIEPLHVRFRSSLWNQLCQMAGRRHGYKASSLKKDPKKGFEARSVTGKKLFFIEPRSEAGKKKAKEILVSRKAETEETSLKFFDLPPEEMALWKEGSPSRELQYELSFWSDLAKWWMIAQEGGEKYEIEFHYVKEGLPKGISAKFPDCEFGFYIAEANWAEIIPALMTVNAPLKVFEFSHQQIKRVVYDPLKKAFLLDIAPIPERKEEKGYPVGEWSFVPEQGFYPAKIDPLLKERVIPQNKVGSFLQKHRKLIQAHLVGAKIHSQPVSARYALSFDAHQALHIGCYVFEKGDLQRLGAASFDSWVYLPDKGFCQLEGLLFEGIQKTIPREEISEFINRHRHWLHGHEGFETHVTSIESKLAYVVTDERILKFDVKLDVAEESEEIFDFGEWVYVKGRGFYAKISRKSGQVLKPGLSIPPNEVASFIRARSDELETVPGFFTTQTPLQKAGLQLMLTDKEQIVVRPEYTLMPLYQGRPVFIFENYTYVAREGFCEISPDLRLPDPYFRETIIEAGAEPYFVSYEIDTLKPFISTIDPRLKKPRELFLRLEVIRFEEGHWRIDLHYESEIGRLDAFTLWEALHANRRHIFSPAGLILLKQPRFNWLKGIPKKRWMQKGSQISLTTLDWMRLFVFEEIREPEEEQSLSILKQFRNAQSSFPLNIEGLKSSLRNYQETGLKWLWFLYSFGLSGLLCDEMGLGKTHQAMALLAAAMNRASGQRYLVVCPTSVIFHWEGLLKRFLPKMKVLVFYGTQRKLVGDYDLLLTSYGTLRSEKSPLPEIVFDVAIFDEIQIAKNTQSQTHKALKLIEAKTRIGLTGTPIENRLLELKALFDVVLPTYMPTESTFKELFVNPIEKQNDTEKRGLLTRFIKPFMLRRKKSEVLLELPEKTEEIAYAPLSEEQQKLYRETYLSAKDQLLSEIEGEGRPTPYIHIFSLLTKLKQICDHPAVALKKPQEYKNHASGKWDLFVELLQETRESGQKLVVFSQYLDMLDIIEAHLKEHHVGYASIRGSTRDRKEQVERFQTDPSCEVFVGSLQAAGVGIDLIAASVVIHYDRWWNPAKENQATDRVHRMGQSRGVQVFKLVMKGTIEEHIHNLIEKKIGLMESVVGYDDQDQIKSLSREELAELVRLMDIDQNK